MATISQINHAFDNADSVANAPTANSYGQAEQHKMRNLEVPYVEWAAAPQPSNLHGVPGSLSSSSATGLSIECQALWATGSGESQNPQSPLQGFFNKFSGEKKMKPDGQPPKRRGPKPDSKPALTRRQELNRQAQRTHRERKEQYIKALEQEVLRLKDIFKNTARERDAVADENRKLRELLASHGITAPESAQPGQLAGDRMNSDSSGSISGSYAPPPPSSTTSDRSHGQMHAQAPTPGSGRPGHSPVSGLNYDQIGIDFVLALERPCMDHAQMLCVRSDASDGEISGHVLNISCPPLGHLKEHPDIQHPHQMPDLQNGDLMKLLDLSNRLPLDGEITPVMAFAQIMRDPAFPYLSGDDFSALKDELLRKVTCYGFGAVLEEFEVADAIQVITSGKADVNSIAIAS